MTGDCPDALGEPERTTSSQRVARTGSGAASAEEHVQGSDHRPFLHTWHYPYCTPKKPFAAIGLPAKGWSNVMLAAVLFPSTTASAYVIRPDRDMRQFDGSIV